MSVSVKKILIFLLFLLAAMLLAAQKDVSVKMSVNGKEKLTVYRNEPLLITLYLNNPKAAADAQWNREAEIGLAALKSQYQHQSITIEKFNAEKEQLEKEQKKNNAVIIGSGENPAFQLLHFFFVNKQGDTVNIPAKLLNAKTVPHQLVLDANNAYGLLCGMRGTAIHALKPEKYSLVVTIDNSVSNRVALTILSYPIPAAKAQTISMQMKLGRFALLYGDVDSAMACAKYIISRQSCSVDGWVLLGDVYVEKLNYAEARKAFETALQNVRRKYPASAEPPEYILSMLQWLKGK